MSRILVVDDDEQVRSVLVLMLEKHGHEVATAASGPLALAAYAAFKPELVSSHAKVIVNSLPTFKKTSVSFSLSVSNERYALNGNHSYLTHRQRISMMLSSGE